MGKGVTVYIRVQLTVLLAGRILARILSPMAGRILARVLSPMAGRILARILSPTGWEDTG
ncbi:2805_t:CDS:2 [Paraglomus brasilianum]|uniref:2805_t:CDS:1 n=1 Tax=Paraglomus brasilianum TaxID=144538 RepID=A0A9N8VTV8_9GLOM|nr:2805_t:CDS:2 [Paraglomus brasilianum]